MIWWYLGAAAYLYVAFLIFLGLQEDSENWIHDTVDIITSLLFPLTMAAKIAYRVMTS